MEEPTWYLTWYPKPVILFRMKGKAVFESQDNDEMEAELKRLEANNELYWLAILNGIMLAQNVPTNSHRLPISAHAAE
jgi:hypothetical protein